MRCQDQMCPRRLEYNPQKPPNVVINFNSTYDKMEYDNMTGEENNPFHYININKL